MKILILEPEKSEQAELAALLSECLPPHPVFAYHAPEDVFRDALPPDADLAFITINSMADAEAARQFERLYGGTPLIVVSDTAEYAVESWRLWAKGYVIRPASRASLTTALHAAQPCNNTRFTTGYTTVLAAR